MSWHRQPALQVVELRPIYKARTVDRNLNLGDLERSTPTKITKLTFDAFRNVFRLRKLFGQRQPTEDLPSRLKQSSSDYAIHDDTCAQSDSDWNTIRLRSQRNKQNNDGRICPHIFMLLLLDGLLFLTLWNFHAESVPEDWLQHQPIMLPLKMVFTNCLFFWRMSRWYFWASRSVISLLFIRNLLQLQIIQNALFLASIFKVKITLRIKWDAPSKQTIFTQRSSNDPSHCWRFYFKPFHQAQIASETSR